MKKKIIFILAIISLFCISAKNFLKADAATNDSAVAVLEDWQFDPYNVKILSSGVYYIFGYSSDIIEESFIGCDYMWQEPGSYEVVEQRFAEELEITIGLSSLTDLFHENISSQDIYKYGLCAIVVKTTACIFTNNECWPSVYIYGIETAPINTDASIAGGKTHFVNIDNMISIDTIKARYTATDNVDGDITNKLKFMTNYNSQIKIPGQFYIYGYVKDNANNYTTIVDIIQVIDVMPPVITGITEKTIDVGTKFTFEEAKALFSATDNSGKDVKMNFTNNYNDRYNTLGRYEILCTAVDAADNVAIATLVINVVDRVKPNISLIDGTDTIYSDHILNETEIKQKFNVTDNYYTIPVDNIKIVSNNCDGTQGKKFNITLSVTDESGNKTEQTFNYYLLDTTAPVITVKDTIYVPFGTKYTNEEIIKFLKEAGIINAASTNISLSNYELNEVGDYIIVFKETLPDGNVNEGFVNINVFDDTPKNNSYWYLLLIIPIFLAVGGFIIIKHRKNEKA